MYSRDLRRTFTPISRRSWPIPVEAAVRERLRRQELLYQSGRQFRFLLTEAALRARLCPAPVHRAQLDRLLVLAGLDTVELAVLPLSTELPKATTHSFEITDDRLILVETITPSWACATPRTSRSTRSCSRCTGHSPNTESRPLH